MSEISVTFEVGQLQVEVADGTAYVLAEETLMLPAVRLVEVLRRLADQIEALNDGWTSDEAREVMEMPWASRDGLREAIPPAYTEHIGRQLLEHLLVAAGSAAQKGGSDA